MKIEPIGVVRNGLIEPGDENWGGVMSEIQLRSDLAVGLCGLEQFSHAVIVFLMHQADFQAQSHLLRRPRDRADMPMLGIFAQRARHRPNPIGITTVQIDRVERTSLFVRGLDAIDGSPVLDVKPHVPAYDAPRHTTVPHWIDELMHGYF